MKVSGLLFLVLFLFSWMSYTQNDPIIEKEINHSEQSLKNQIKVNLASLIWRTGSLNYERKVSNRWTVGLTANYRPKGTAPFKSTLQNIFGEKNKTYLDNSFDIDQLEYGNVSVSPEIKLYLGKSGAFKGFYIAGFVKYEDIDIDYNYPFIIESQGHSFQTVLPLKGSLTAWTGGIYIGHQWQLGNKWHLDWQIIGGNFGGGSLSVSAQHALTQSEQDQLLSFAEKIQDQLSDLNYEVNNQGAKIWGNIPWAGLRTGLSIGYSF